MRTNFSVDMGLERTGEHYFRKKCYSFASSCFINAAERETDSKKRSELLYKAADCYFQMSTGERNDVFIQQALNLLGYSIDEDVRNVKSWKMKIKLLHKTEHFSECFHLCLMAINLRLFVGKETLLFLFNELIELSFSMNRKFTVSFVDMIEKFILDNWDFISNQDGGGEIVYNFLKMRKSRAISENVIRHLASGIEFDSYYSQEIGFMLDGKEMIRPTFFRTADLLILESFLPEKLRKENISINEYKYIIVPHSQYVFTHLRLLGYKPIRTEFDFSLFVLVWNK